LQRIFDIIFSIIFIILLSPVFLAVIITLRFTGEGKIFFRQPRIGKHKKIILILKFATMLEDSPNLGSGTITLMNDPRVLPFGKILRKTKINELPQLLNIFLGDMSFVGPRPQTQRCFYAFPDKSQKKIATVRPGLSGVGSIFFRNEEIMLHNSNNADKLYDEIIMPFKGELEEWYINHKSTRLYFLIIICTIIVVLTGKIPFKKKIFVSLPEIPNKLSKYI
jgi:lipopolysaccharide/colanic/teichoic acid biosynthesis glycosyltransferase